MSHVSLQQLIAAGSYVGGGLVLGIALRFLFGRLAHRAARTRWVGDDLVFDFLHRVALGTALVAGVWGAVVVLPFNDRWHHTTTRLLIALVIAIITFALARSAAQLIKSATLSKAGVAQSATIFVNITRVVVLAIGLLVVLDSLGVSIAPLITALGVGGLAVALALQDTLSNLFAGIHILASKKVQPGDFVRLDSGQQGYVVDINWRNTIIRELPNNLIIVPNAKLASSILTNFNQPEQEMSVLVQVGVSYDSDLKKVEQVTIDVAKEVMRKVTGGVPTHDPFIRYHTFNDSSIDFSVILRGKEFTDQFLITHEFIKQLHERYRSEGITIPFPMRTVVMSSPVPEQRLG
jgi:small-conductance mechanosensitive channel